VPGHDELCGVLWRLYGGYPCWIGNGRMSADFCTQEEIMGFIGPTELAIIAFIMVMLFGAKRIPELMKGLGEGIKGLRDGVRDD